MSDNSNSSCLPECGQAVHHDLRHTLFTLRTGIKLLGQVRENPDEFAELQRLLQQEVKVASELIDRVLGRPDSLVR